MNTLFMHKHWLVERAMGTIESSSNILTPDAQPAWKCSAYETVDPATIPTYRELSVGNPETEKEDIRRYLSTSDTSSEKLLILAVKPYTRP